MEQCMKNQKKPIHRSLILGSAVFITFMCLLLSIQAYLTYSQSLYKRYDDKLSNILNYAVNRIDMDDLYQNAITGQKTEKYNDVQQLLNGMVDDFELFYLYSLFVRNDSMYNICSATSKAERERGEEDMKLLEPTDAYELSEIRKFAKAMTKDEISFFEENSDWGAAYTACKPYVNSLGVHFGVICADISISDLHKTVNNYVMYNVLLTLGLGLLFALILFIWLRRNVTGPILELEKSQVNSMGHGNLLSAYPCSDVFRIRAMQSYSYGQGEYFQHYLLSCNVVCCLQRVVLNICNSDLS